MRFQAVGVMDVLSELAKDQEKRGSPFEVLRVAYRERGWFLSEKELGVIRGYVGRFDVFAGDGALDRDVNKYFLNGFERCQWFGMVPEFI
jgi:hypothetical protein